MVALSLLVGFAWAGAPDLVVVGVHVPGLTGAAAEQAAAKLTAALDATGKVDALGSAEVSRRISGREGIILDAFALGAARERLREGQILYDRAQPDQAIPALEQASRLLAAGLSTSTDARDLGEALTLLGLAHSALGDEAAARSAFRRVVALDPARQLDANTFPPPIVALYEAVRAAANAEPKATFRVDAPSGTPVWLDGRPLGDAPLSDRAVVSGAHHLLARSASGASYFKAFAVGPAETALVEVTLGPRAVGRAAPEAVARARQTRDLYRSIGEYTDRDPVLLAGITSSGQVALQLYSPASGTFSEALTADAGSDPVAAIVDLSPAIVAFLTEAGDINSDRISPQVIALDVGSNDVLAGMLLDPPGPTVAAGGARGGPPWYLWAGLGALVAGGGATAAVVLTADSPDEGGVITFGPIP